MNESQPRLDRLIAGVSNRLSPGITLLATVASFALCVWLGSICAGEKKLFENFVRFHSGISMDTQFLPTFSMIYNLAEEEAKRNKYLVIVSGDSVFYGEGQTVDRVWTRRLQKDLGSDYKVLNLAFRGGAALESGYWVFEALSKKYNNVFLVGNSWGTYCTSAIGGTAYSFHFWDALSHGYLQSFPAREDWIARYQTEFLEPTANQRLNEAPLQMRLDSVLHFRSLWTTVFYKFASPLWISGTFLQPRRASKDWTPPHPPPLGSNENIWIRSILNQNSGRFEPQADGTSEFAENNYSGFAHWVDATAMPSLREKILIVLLDPCPLFLRKLPASTLLMREKIQTRSAQIYRKMGFNTLRINQLEDKDYVDGKHLTTSGGDKIADLIAPKLKEICSGGALPELTDGTGEKLPTRPDGSRPVAPAADAPASSTNTKD